MSYLGSENFHKTFFICAQIPCGFIKAKSSLCSSRQFSFFFFLSFHQRLPVYLFSKMTNPSLIRPVHTAYLEAAYVNKIKQSLLAEIRSTDLSPA